MRLYIAEKPSLGRAIAEVLPKPHRKGEGCIYVANGDCVSWCVGHLLEQAEPDAYDPSYKQWRQEHLPIIPPQWQLKPKPSSRKQLAVLRGLVKQADQIIHAGDPDREGQLLVDQVIDYLKVSRAKRDAIQRCLINDLNPSAVKRALQKLRDNKEFIPLSTSALARSRADWLYGINMTRSFTLQGRKVGYQGVLSVGRVQTPILGLVVGRDQQIENFVAKPFYQLIAHLATEQGQTFTAKWQPSEACLPWQDEEGRVLSKALVENVATRINRVNATVTAAKKQLKKQPPPLPYSLSSLQIDAAKRYSMSAKQVLDCCQALYERHKLLTYPRSDSRYLPVEHLAARAEVLLAISNNVEALSDAVRSANQGLKSKAWNDSKVDAHHAIIPTTRKVDLGNLSQAERNVYQLVARQYVAQFYPAHQYSDSQIALNIGGGRFIARSKETVEQGWKQLFPAAKQATTNKTPQEITANKTLPPLAKGDHCLCQHGQIIDKKTTPPKPFDDASLLSAMTGIARYVTDPEIRKVLKETDGLGTEATRAGIIELLFQRDFLHRKGKHIHATKAGTGLINSLPEAAITPDMTAHWETQLNAICQREASYQSFMQPLEATLLKLIEQSQSQLPKGLDDIKAKKGAFKKRSFKKPSSKNSRKPSQAKRTNRSTA
jgi:DNA topoisomerase-3